MTDRDNQNDFNDEDDEENFYSDNERKFYILSFLISGIENDDLYDELIRIGKKLEVDEESNIQELYAFENRIIPLLRERIASNDIFSKTYENPEIAGLIRRFELLFLKDKLIDEEDPGVELETTYRFIEMAGQDFHGAVDYAGDHLRFKEDAFISYHESYDEDDEIDED